MTDGMIDPYPFYWDSVIFKVEDKLFCVPRYGFEQSEVFSDMFSLPAGEGQSVEGRDNAHPIVLEGYKEHEFGALIKVLYPTANSLIQPEGTELDLSLSQNEWISVLKLSTRWRMEKIRSYAIHKLSSTPNELSPIDKILYGIENKVAKWLKGGVAAIVQGPPIPISQFSAVGWKVAAQILSIKDHQWTSPALSTYPVQFRLDSMKCMTCVINGRQSNAAVFGKILPRCSYCNRPLVGRDVLFSINGATGEDGKHSVQFGAIRCGHCNAHPSRNSGVNCSNSSCDMSWTGVQAILIIPLEDLQTAISNVFEKEIKECQWE